MFQDLRLQRGDNVRVHYTSKFQGGKIFDTLMNKVAGGTGVFNPSRDYKPLTIKVGTGQVIRGFEEALMGMKVNEEKSDNPS